jgi:hypothetical protein
MTRRLNISFETVSRRAATTGYPSQPGAHGDSYASPIQFLARNRSHAPAAVNPSTPMMIQSSAIIPLPSRSILAAPIAPLKALNLAKSRFHETLRFALLLSFSIWGLFALSIWVLFFNAR